MHGVCQAIRAYRDGGDDRDGVLNQQASAAAPAIRIAGYNATGSVTGARQASRDTATADPPEGWPLPKGELHVDCVESGGAGLSPLPGLERNAGRVHLFPQRVCSTGP